MPAQVLIDRAGIARYVHYGNSMVEAGLAKYEKLRLLYQTGPEFDGYDADAVWDDAKIGMQHFSHFEKNAFVTDHTWMARSVKAFGFLMPGEVRLFGDAQFDVAMAWITN